MDNLHKKAIVDVHSGTAATYRMLQDAAGNLADMLTYLQAAAGSVIAIHSTSRMEQALYLLAGLQLPYIINPLNPEYSIEQLQTVTAHAAPALVISDQPDMFRGMHVRVMPANLKRLLVDRHNDNEYTFEIAGNLLIYTSGTTGNPKGVYLSARNITANTSEAIRAFGFGSESISASILPLFHTFTIISDLIPVLRAGGTCVICPAFSALQCAAIQEHLVTQTVQTFSAVPVIFQAMTSILQRAPVSALRFVISGGAPLSEPVRLAYNEKFGHPVIPCYGLGEVTCFATISPLNAIKPRAVGLPAGISIRVADPGNADHHLPAGMTGELVMKGESVMEDGYYNDHSGRKCYNSHGEFLTGDLGHIDEDGYVYVTGRKKNMIIRGGTKIYLEDVDRCLEELPAVSQSASVASTREGLPDRSLSFVVLASADSIRKEEIRAYVGKRLSDLHMPDDIYFINEIPRTKTGKPMLQDLLRLSEQPV